MTTVPIAPLYLSRLILNPRSRQVMSEMAHPYEMHRTLMRAFPEARRIQNSRHAMNSASFFVRRLTICGV